MHGIRCLHIGSCVLPQQLSSICICIPQTSTYNYKRTDRSTSTKESARITYITITIQFYEC